MEGNQEVTTHKQRKISKRLIIIDKSIYNQAQKKKLPALKRGFYIKGAEEKRRKRSHV